MTDQLPLVLSDDLLERMLGQRAGPGAPDDLVPAIAAAIGATPQRRPWLMPPVVLPRSARSRVLLLAAALVLAGLAATVAIVGSNLQRDRNNLTVVPTSSVAPGPSLAPTAPPTRSSAAASWRVTGSMGKAREFHTATSLADGRVLVAGGSLCCPTLVDAELFDPTTGTWSATGSMTTARRFHTASLLADGNVLVVGGLSDIWDPAKPRNSAELYDPTTGTCSATRSMITARSSHTATVLGDGRVLVAGGTAAATGGPQDGSDLNTTEIYDPATGTWAVTGSMITARDTHLAVLLADGGVLVVGGRNRTHSLAPAELYDPSTGTWSRTGSPTMGSVYTATLLEDGRVLATGAGVDETAGASAELYDPSSGTWSPTGNLTVARAGYTATRLGDGMVLVAGGVGAGQKRSPRLRSTTRAPALGRWSGPWPPRARPTRLLRLRTGGFSSRAAFSSSLANTWNLRSCTARAPGIDGSLDQAFVGSESRSAGG
jgi:Kelch motif/Galactose oxidase, central domain